MEQGSKKRLHIAELRQKLQDDVNIILSDIADYISANDEGSEDGEIKVHFDVDMVLRNMHIPRRVTRHPKRVMRAQAHASLIPHAMTTESERPMPHYNPEFFKGSSVGNDKRPFGKLNDAARFVFKHI